MMRRVTLVPATEALWHDFYRAYVPDLMMDATPWQYDFDRVSDSWSLKGSDPTRRYFYILADGVLAGEIYLKHMDIARGTSSLGMALVDDRFKSRGIGTEALRQLIAYAFGTLGLTALDADTVHRNTRSRRVLEKCGFAFTGSDDTFHYFHLEREATP